MAAGELAQAWAHVEGLRLDGGALVLKVEKDAMAVQVRIADPAPPLADGGVPAGPRLGLWRSRSSSPG